MYLGISPSISNWSSGNDEFSLTFESTPFAEFVELPDTCSNLKYSNILPGVIRGACEMVCLINVFKINSSYAKVYMICSIYAKYKSW